MMSVAEPTPAIVREVPGPNDDYEQWHRDRFPGRDTRTILTDPKTNPIVRQIYFNVDATRTFERELYGARFAKDTGEPLAGMSPDLRLANMLMVEAVDDMEKALNIPVAASTAGGIALPMYKDSETPLVIDRRGRVARFNALKTLVAAEVSDIQTQYPNLVIDAKDELTGMDLPHDSLKYLQNARQEVLLFNVDKDIPESRRNVWRLTQTAYAQKSMSKVELIAAGQGLFALGEKKPVQEASASFMVFDSAGHRIQ